MMRNLEICFRCMDHIRFPFLSVVRKDAVISSLNLKGATKLLAGSRSMEGLYSMDYYDYDDDNDDDDDDDNDDD